MATLLTFVGMREAELQHMEQGAQKTRAVFHATSRSLIGLRSDIANATRGMAVFNHLFHSYVPYEVSTSKYLRLILNNYTVRTTPN